MTRVKFGAVLVVCLSAIALILAIQPPPAGGANAPLLTPTSASFLPAVSQSIPTATPPPTPTTTPTGPPWLQYVNSFRAGTGLPQLDENSSWSSGGVLHSRYLVKNDVITHAEDPGNAWYTAEGDAAGRNGNVMVSSWVSAPDSSAIDLWMTGPFHALGILDPRLQTTGFGSYREADGGWQMGATLDVIRGRGSLPPGFAYPVPFPPPNGVTWLASYNGGEWPDPLSSCAGYSAPSGPPLMVQLGSGGLTPNVTATSLSSGGTPLDHCWYSETTYTNPDAGSQSTGRVILNSRDAVVLMPRAPLQEGQTYTVSVTANGTTVGWSFSVVTHPLGSTPYSGEARMEVPHVSQPTPEP